MCQDSKVKSSPNVRHKHVLFDVNIQKHIPDIRLDKFIGQINMINLMFYMKYNKHIFYKKYQKIFAESEKFLKNKRNVSRGSLTNYTSFFEPPQPKKQQH